MKRKLTALLLAMTFVFATVAPTMAASKQASASSNKTATVSVEKSKDRGKVSAFFAKLLPLKKARSGERKEAVGGNKALKEKKLSEENSTDEVTNPQNPGENDGTTKHVNPETNNDGNDSQSGTTEEGEKTDPEEPKKENKVDVIFSLRVKSKEESSEAKKEELTGAKLEILKKVDGSSKEEQKWDSKKDPETFKLEPGDYVFKMADKLKGYKMPVDIPFEVKDGKITVDGKELEPVEGKNVLIMAVEKEEIKTLFGIRVGDEELSGAELKIVEKPEKDSDKGVTPVDTWNITKTPGELKLPKGKYELAVTKLPDGYKVEKVSVDFEITEDGEIKVAEADKEHLKIEGAEYNLFLKAAPTENQFVFRLKDSNGKDIIGPELQIKDSAGRTIKWFSEKNVKGINISEFSDGDYEFSQTTVPYGYSAAEPIRFTVKDHKIVQASYGLTNFGPLQELTLVSKSAKRVVTFSRVDSLGKILLGVEIEIYKDGTKIASWKSGSDHHKLELEAGVYRYHEAAVVLGHKIAKDFEFEVKADGSIVLRGIQLGEMVKLKEGGHICVGEAGGKLEEDPNKKPEEKPGQTNQKKPTNDTKNQAKNHWVEFDVAKKDGTLLEGAVVEIYQNGKLLESWTTSNTGYKTQLQPGSYRFHTKTAPQGYQLARDFNFAVNRDGSITLGKLQSGDTVTAKDGRIVVYGDPISATGTRTSGTTAAASNGRLPKTGDGISPVFYAVGLAAVGAVILGIGIKKRRESVDEVK